jgi:hypothetical protein
MALVDARKQQVRAERRLEARRRAGRERREFRAPFLDAPELREEIRLRERSAQVARILREARLQDIERLLELEPSAVDIGTQQPRIDEARVEACRVRRRPGSPSRDPGVVHCAPG